MPVMEIIQRTTTRTVQPTIHGLPLFTCTPADPFEIDDPCPGNAGGHQFIADCSDVVCPHCGKVVWQ